MRFTSACFGFLMLVGQAVESVGHWILNALRKQAEFNRDAAKATKYLYVEAMENI